MAGALWRSPAWRRSLGRMAGPNLQGKGGTWAGTEDLEESSRSQGRPRRAGRTRQRRGQTGPQRLGWVEVWDEASVGEAETSSFPRGARPRELCKQRALRQACERLSTGGSTEGTEGCWKRKRGHFGVRESRTHSSGSRMTLHRGQLRIKSCRKRVFVNSPCRPQSTGS